MSIPSSLVESVYETMLQQRLAASQIYLLRSCSNAHAVSMTGHSRELTSHLGQTFQRTEVTLAEKTGLIVLEALYYR